MTKRYALLVILLAAAGHGIAHAFEKYSKLRFDFDDPDVGILESNETTGTQEPEVVPNVLVDKTTNANVNHIAQQVNSVGIAYPCGEERTVFDTDAFFGDTLSKKQLCLDKPCFAKEKDKKDKHCDFDKPVEKPVLFIKGHGRVCEDLKVKGNVCVNGGLKFNQKGCHKLWAKGTKEKNLLNLRGVLHFDCNPFLRLSLNTICGEALATLQQEPVQGPAVGCIDDQLICTLGNGTVRVNSGCGFKDSCAKISCSGTTCLSKQVSGICADFSLVTTVSIELCIPLCFIVPFCDCPTVIVSHEDRAMCSRSICIDSSNNAVECDVEFLSNGTDGLIAGNNVFTFLGTDVFIRSTSRKLVGVILRMSYQYCIGRFNDSEGLADELVCKLQQEAIKQMGVDANKRLRDLTISVLAEGRVL